MVRSTIRLLIPLEKQKEALEILSSISEQIQFEQGCISSRIYQDIRENLAIMFEEIWTNEYDLNRHLQSDKYRKVLLVVEMATESPEIRFDTIAESSGVETIEKARAQTEPVSRI